jgi:CheY-like chemotaxis protein
MVRAAIDGLSGLAALAESVANALVINYAMPGMNGTEIARHHRWG